MAYTCYHNWHLESVDLSSAIEELLRELPFSAPKRELLAAALETREQAGPTVVGEGIAIPHCRSILVDEMQVVLGRSGRGIPWPDEKVSTIILFVSPARQTGPGEHMEFIRHVAGKLRGEGSGRLRRADDAAEAAALLKLDLCEDGGDDGEGP